MGTLPDLHEEICNQVDARDDLDLLGKHLDENESRVTVGTPELGVLTLVVSAYLKEWWIDESEPDPEHHGIAFSVFGYRIGGVEGEDGSPGRETFGVHDAAAFLIERAMGALRG